jgi:hypothetical protein
VNINSYDLFYIYISKGFLFLVPPRFVSYSPTEGSVSYSEGSSMNLSCRAFAVPSANITWIYRDKNKQSKSNLLIII